MAGTGLNAYTYGLAAHPDSPDADGYAYTGGTCTPTNPGSCHSPGDWGAAGGCNFCHGDPPATGAHAVHVNANGDTDRTDCANCHSGISGYTGSGSANGNHRNGSTDVSGEWDAATTGLGVQWSDNGTPANPADDTCTNACHLNDNGVNLPAAVWGATQLDCSSCHYYSTDPTAERYQRRPSCMPRRDPRTPLWYRERRGARSLEGVLGLSRGTGGWGYSPHQCPWSRVGRCVLPGQGIRRGPRRSYVHSKQRC